MKNKQKSLKKLFEIADVMLDAIIQECAVNNQVNFDELDVIVDRLKLLKDRLISFEATQTHTINEINKALKKVKKVDVHDLEYVQ